MTLTDTPPYDELPLLDGVPCSWGVWGDHDVFGCLNRLTPARAAAAARLVERGDVFSLNLGMALPDPPLFGRARMEHEVKDNPGSRSTDELLHNWNTSASSQWDGFRHQSREVHGHYGGVPSNEHGVDHWSQRGLAGRAVLCDVSRWRSSARRPIAHGTPDPIEPEDITSTLEAQGVEVHEGDVLLLRTGWVEWYLSLGEEERRAISKLDTLFSPGLRPVQQSARLLWNLGLAAIAADNPALEIWPLGTTLDPELAAAIQADPTREHEMLLHTHLLPMLGMPIGELFDLEALAADCARDGRYDCFFTSAPINLTGGVASPPNALALK